MTASMEAGRPLTAGMISIVVAAALTAALPGCSSASAVDTPQSERQKSHAAQQKPSERQGAAIATLSGRIESEPSAPFSAPRINPVQLSAELGAVGRPSRVSASPVRLSATPEARVAIAVPQRPAPEIEPNHDVQIPAFPEAVPVKSAQPAASPQTIVWGGPPAAMFPLGAATAVPCRVGVGCPPGCPTCAEHDWSNERPIPWEIFAQGEYVGPARLPHVPEYRVRVDDLLEFVYRLTGDVTGRPYRLNVGDRIRVESLTAETVDREVLIQPDGTVTLQLLGQVPAAGRTVEELRADLEQRYLKYVKQPSITVTPLEFNTRLQELRATVDSRFGQGGQSRQARVTPEGTVQLPAIGSVPAQGLTLDELKLEIEYRYAQIVPGIEVTPVLAARAPRFVYVLGEVREPGRYVLEGPTTVLQAMAMAGSWNIGARLDQIVVLRRDDNWQLMATRLELHDTMFGRDPCPSDEIWLRDSDVIIVPKSPIQWTGDLIELIFTRGIYGVVPVNYSVSFSKLSTI